MALLLVSCPRPPALCLFCLSPFLCPLSHVSVPCLPSSIPYPTALLLVSHPLSPSHGSAPCLPSSVPFSWLCSLSPILCPLLMALLLVSHPLSPSHGSAPCFPSSVPFSWLCSLSPVLFPCLTSLLFVSHPLSPVSCICSLPTVYPSCLSTVPVSHPLMLYSTVPVLCFSVSHLLFLHNCPLSLILARMRVFLKNIHAYT
jgi:hypothetical protein